MRRLILAMLNGGKQKVAAPLRGEGQTVVPCLECVCGGGGGGQGGGSSIKQHPNV